MAVKNILVVYNGTEGSKSALKMALDLAANQDAHITGLNAHSIAPYIAKLDPYVSAEFAEVLTRQEAERQTKVEQDFHEQVAEEGATDRARFFTAQGQPDRICAQFARTYDLVVVGQPKTEAWEAHLAPHPDSVALQSGRPVLVAPKTIAPLDLSKGAILAWDGKRAASRALADAMGLLEDAASLTVLHVAEDDSAVRQPGRDVMEHLSRHGVHAELLVMPTAGRPVGEIVLETAKLSGAGLLVMGAYEHSKFSETILGGVTKDVLSQIEMPVLISH